MNETIKTVATYVIAGLVIVGGGLLLIVPSQVPSEQLLPFLTGIIGTVIGYVFSERSSSSGASSATPNTTYVNSEPPTTVNVGEDQAQG